MLAKKSNHQDANNSNNNSATSSPASRRLSGAGFGDSFTSVENNNQVLEQQVNEFEEQLKKVNGDNGDGDGQQSKKRVAKSPRSRKAELLRNAGGKRDSVK